MVGTCLANPNKIKQKGVLIFMNILKLTFKKLVTIRLGLLPLIMLIFMTIRTVMGGDALMISGLCVAFIPFFATVRRATEIAPHSSEREEVFSDYFMQFIACTIGLVYLKLLTELSAAYNPHYIPSDFTREMFWFSWICNYAFVSITVPVTYALNRSQRMTMAILLANIEIGFMVLLHSFLEMSNGAFVLEQQYGIALLALLMPIYGLGTIGMKYRKSKKAQKQNDEEQSAQ